MPMDWDGKIYAVKQLGQHVMIYGQGGVSYITSNSGTWGQRAFKVFGVPYHTAVSGNKNRHYFVDSSGELWTAGANNKLTSLGGKGFISPMMKDNIIVVTHHPRRNECYISGPDYHYVRTRTGWGGPNEVPISGAAYHHPTDRPTGGLVMVPARGGSVNLPEAMLITDTIAFGYEGQKTIQWITVALDHDADEVHMSAYYRYSGASNWEQTEWVRANKEGIAYLPIAGIEFQLAVRLRGNQLTQCYIDGMQIKWKATDSRFSRGTNPATATQRGDE